MWGPSLRRASRQLFGTLPLACRRPRSRLRAQGAPMMRGFGPSSRASFILAQPGRALHRRACYRPYRHHHHHYHRRRRLLHRHRHRRHHPCHRHRRQPYCPRRRGLALRRHCSGPQPRRRQPLPHRRTLRRLPPPPPSLSRECRMLPCLLHGSRPPPPPWGNCRRRRTQRPPRLWRRRRLSQTSPQRRLLQLSQRPPSSRCRSLRPDGPLL